MIRAFSNQHDENHGGTLKEAFFLEKLGDDLNVTGRSMRVKEEPLLAQETFNSVTTDTNFNHLCRGIKLVPTINIITRIGQIIKFGHFQMVAQLILVLVGL